MNDMKKFKNYGIILLLAAFCVFALIDFFGPKIGNTFSQISSCLDCQPASEPTPIIEPSTTDIFIPVTGGETFTEIDRILSESLGASLAYNAPSEMEVGETVTIELLLNPSLSQADLAAEVSEPGTVVSGTVEITPQMKAEIKLPTQDALTVTPLHDAAVQFISGTETTKWSWFVTAKKSGVQRLTIVVYRLVKVDGTESWREVETYKSDIDVKVTLASQLKSLDWKWIIGILVTALLVPGFWRWYDTRKKKSEAEDAGKEKATKRKKKS